MSRPEALRARDAWAEAVWESDLKPLERLVAQIYADHARDGLMRVFVDGERLRRRTGLSRDAANRALRGLEAAGWLTVVEKARQHYATRYALTYPAQGSVSQNAETSGTSDGTLSITSDGTLDEPSVPSRDASVPSRDASVPGDGNDPSSYLSSPPPPRLAALEDAAPAVPPEHPQHHAVEAALRSAGVIEFDLRAVTDLALTDPSTTGSVVGRITRVPSYVDQLVRQVRTTREQNQRRSATAQRCAALQAELDAAGDLGTQALETARHVLGTRPDDHGIRLLTEAVRELHDLHAELGAPVSA